MSDNALLTHLGRAVALRLPMMDDKHEGALRLFNGFLEGDADLAIDLYARTLLIHNYADPPNSAETRVAAAQAELLARFPWIEAVVVKTRKADSAEGRNGIVTVGSKPNHWIREHGVRYAIDLTMNRDASLYLDTRNLRRWALDQLAGQRVLNTFAYTGSLGVAAMAASASQVVHVDLNRQFLNVAKTSYTLNGFPIHRPDFIAVDFWPQMKRFNRARARFDCIFVDPPFFATTARGTVDLTREPTRLVNKVRPLVVDGGRIVLINNALFVSGADMMAELEALSAEGYVAIEETIAVPLDFTGSAETRTADFVTDPAPFNHSTKIVVLRISHKRR